MPETVKKDARREDNNNGNNEDEVEASALNRALPSFRRIARYVEEKAETIGESAVLEGRPLAVSSCGILSTKCSYPGDSAGGQRAFRGVATMVGDCCL